jgi:hypothetical protein
MKIGSRKGKKAQSQVEGQTTRLKEVEGRIQRRLERGNKKGKNGVTWMGE